MSGKMQDPERVRTFYDEFADYQLSYVLTPNPRFLEIRKRLKPFLDAGEARSALDVGCGIGVQTDWLADHVPRVVGIDISPRNVAIASRLYPRVSFSVCSLPGGELPEGPFDLVTAFDVFEHFDNADRPTVFNRIGQVLATDALLAINIPSRLFALQNPPETKQIIDEAVGVEELVACAAAVDFELLSLDRYGIEKANQYAFLLFGRSYDVESPPEPLPLRERLRRRRDAWFTYRRGTRLIARVHGL